MSSEEVGEVIPEAECDLDTYKEFEPIVLKMKAYGIESVTVCFYGGGDSGQIEEISWHPKQPPPMCKIPVTTVKRTSSWSEERGIYIHQEETGTEQKPLEQALEDLTYRLISDTGVDWYNNEGGGGEFSINLSKDRNPYIDFNVWYNVTETETGYDNQIELNL